MLRSPSLRTAALLLLVAVAFGRVAAHEFVNFDDDKFIYANERLLPPTIAALGTASGASRTRISTSR